LASVFPQESFISLYSFHQFFHKNPPSHSILGISFSTRILHLTLFLASVFLQESSISLYSWHQFSQKNPPSHSILGISFSTRILHLTLFLASVFPKESSISLYSWHQFSHKNPPSHSILGISFPKRILHLTLFLASVLISIQIFLTLLASTSTVLRHVFLCLPLPLLPWGFHSRAVFLNRRALASIIPGRERFYWNLSF